MFYNNLIYLLVVIFILTTKTIPETPTLTAQAALLLFLLKGAVFYLTVRFTHNRGRIYKATKYFAAEQRLSILAIVAIGIDVYFLDCQYYLASLPGVKTLPTLGHLCGMFLFFGYLAIIWTEARKSYGLVFKRHYHAWSFTASNLKTNLPIILPWLILSLLSDLLQTSSQPVIRNFLASPWGEPTLFLVLFLFMAVVFPALIIRLWGCTPLPPGEDRDKIESFCRSQNLAYANIMIWPLFEGRMLTAGVMGLTRRFRYLLITPGLLKAMNQEEIDAVLAHEIGHVKRHHLHLYILFFAGFLIFAQLGSYPTLYLLLTSNIFYKLVQLSGQSPNDALIFASMAPMMILMLVYFRYIFGFFMRNFERQADLHVFSAMADSRPLVLVLEKIAWLSGNIRDLPSWHHFGIGQRVDFLLRCEQDRSLIKRHDRKVSLALSLYLLAAAVAGFIIWKMPANLLDGAPRVKFAEAVIEQKISQTPSDPLWHHLLGDLEHERKQYQQAISAYEQALSLDPDNQETLNNFAWLLLTAEEQSLRNPQRALQMAQKAATLSPASHILDTLARAYWLTGNQQQAIASEEQALLRAPGNQKYYRQQLQLFQTTAPPLPAHP
ncbi:MAG: M48 family metalloprotease [Desulfobulbaceae bacterium]|nr:M48 family metalloprotease [Desulfobulbaceae bacterium]